MYDKTLKEMLLQNVDIDITVSTNKTIFNRAVKNFCEDVAEDNFNINIDTDSIYDDIQEIFNVYINEVVKEMIQEYIIQKDIMDIDTINITID